MLAAAIDPQSCLQVAVTAAAAEADEGRLKGWGVDRVLAKPLTTDHLKKLLHSYRKPKAFSA